MLKLQTLDGKIAEIEDEVLDNFRNGFSGQLIGPDDPEYDSARKVWNALIDKRPGLIARCAGQADVVKFTVAEAGQRLAGSAAVVPAGKGREPSRHDRSDPGGGAVRAKCGEGGHCRYPECIDRRGSASTSR